MTTRLYLNDVRGNAVQVDLEPGTTELVVPVRGLSSPYGNYGVTHTHSLTEGREVWLFVDRARCRWCRAIRTGRK